MYLSNIIQENFLKKITKLRIMSKTVALIKKIDRNILENFLMRYFIG